MKCIECNKKMTSKREVYRYTESGLNNVYLETDVHRCAKCKESIVDIPNIYGLHEMIAEDLIIGVDKVTVSRWENDAAQISVANDKLLRLIYVQKYQEKCDIILEIIDFLEKIQPTSKNRKITISKEDLQKAPGCML
jgi:hypothetical protein